MREPLDRYLESVSRLAGAAPADAAERPSSFGPLRLPEPGQPPEAGVLARAGLPIDLLDGLLARKGEPDFAGRVYRFARAHRDALPRLLRQVGWALVREDPRLAGELAARLMEEGALDGPGEIAFLCDLAEEAPAAIGAHLGRVLDLLVEGGDRADPAEGGHRLSDVLCLAAVPEPFVREAIAPAWERVADARTRAILLRLLVHHRVLRLDRFTGVLEEQLHGTKQRYAYSYHLRGGERAWRVVDLTRAPLFNLSELPKYAPAIALRRFVGHEVEVEGRAEGEALLAAGLRVLE